jgi:indolepyruvate ferredoxin oxidoreductase beta subunit
MSQRGGSVVSHVRFGRIVNSPIIREGEADILFGFELLETYRYLSLVKKGGKVVANNLQISPPSVLSGQESYPEDLVDRIRALFPDFLLVDGLGLASAAGNSKTANTVLLGAVSKRLDIDEHFWLAALGKMVPSKALEANKKAFQLGRSL